MPPKPEPMEGGGSDQPAGKEIWVDLNGLTGASAIVARAYDRMIEVVKANPIPTVSNVDMKPLGYLEQSVRGFDDNWATENWSIKKALLELTADFKVAHSAYKSADEGGWQQIEGSMGEFISSADGPQIPSPPPATDPAKPEAPLADPPPSPSGETPETPPSDNPQKPAPENGSTDGGGATAIPGAVVPGPGRKKPKNTGSARPSGKTAGGAKANGAHGKGKGSTTTGSAGKGKHQGSSSANGISKKPPRATAPKQHGPRTKPAPTPWHRPTRPQPKNKECDGDSDS
ncbi:hypothetical protein [Nocardia panacis]|nr:hypothetical protein [Nocardia panacis]